MTILIILAIITGNNFIRVSVCPPVNTSTNLNKDLLNTENVALNREARDELVKLAAVWLEGNVAKDLFEELRSLKEENQWKNWYLGYTVVRLPYTDYNQRRMYKIFSTAVPGSASSPLFRQEFSEDTFRKKIIPNYIIYLPDSITAPGNLSMVFQIQMDLKETYGGKDMFGVGIIDVQFKEYRHTGPVNDTLRFPLASVYTMWLDRDLDNASYAEWKTKRMTGFTVSWHLENDTGNKVDIQPSVKYSGFEMNKEFVRMVNILHYALYVKNISVDKMWDSIKLGKIDLIVAEKEKAAAQSSLLGVFQTSHQGVKAAQCNTYQLVDSKIIKQLLDAEEKKLNLTGVRWPVYQDSIRDKTLETAARMYVYIKRCITPADVVLIQFYADLLRNYPTRYILQTLANLSKMKDVERKHKIIPADLIQALGNYFHPEIDIINLATGSGSDLLLKLKTGKIAINQLFRKIGDMLLE